MAPTAEISRGLERVGVRLHADQIREVKDVGDELREDFSAALRFVVRQGLVRIQELKAEGRLVA